MYSFKIINYVCSLSMSTMYFTYLRNMPFSNYRVSKTDVRGSISKSVYGSGRKFLGEMVLGE